MFDDRSGPGAALFSALLSGLASRIRPGFVVAVPVKDEEERLPACLRALAQQRDQLGQPIPPTLVRIVVFANNCSDRSASLARKLGGGLSLDVRVVEARLPPAVAHAGSARRAVMDLAEAWLVEAGEKDGVILTTDADSQVAANWIAENLAAFAAGAEAVLGRIDLDEEGARLPEALHRRGELSRFRLANQRIGFLRFAACADSQGVWHGGKVSGYGERRTARRPPGSCRFT